MAEDSANKPSGAELRQTARERCSAAALTRLYVPATDKRFFAWVHDISSGGAALDLRTQLEPGTEVLCQLRGIEPHERFDVFARVMHVRLVEGLYHAGCKFNEPLPQHQLDAVLRKLGRM